MKKLVFLSLMLLTVLSATDKIYLDESELDFIQGKVRFHQGNNVWLESLALRADKTGIFTLEQDIVKTPQSAYERSWKCPYCYRHWPIGQRCQNPDCPSKYF